MNPTIEQEAILTAATSTSANLSINALAGTGKSTTLKMIERAVKTVPILYLAFNKPVVTAIEYITKVQYDKLSGDKKPTYAEEAARRMQSTTTVRTFNGFGHRVWSQATGKSRLNFNPKKVQDILRALIDELPKANRSPAWDSFWEVINGVNMARALGYLPEGKYTHVKPLCTAATLYAALEEEPDDLVGDLIDIVLTRSIAAAYEGTIDYNDQVYMPALFGGVYPRYPLNLIDEEQDLNPVNHEMLRRLVKTRSIGVGDPWQSIYGFRGAVQSGMAALKRTFGATSLDLSVSFRCPSAIVENARWRVPHFKWLKDGGYVEVLSDMDGGDFPNDGCAILCRNNAPLFRVAFNLLKLGRSVSVAGSDIGPKIVATMRKLGDADLSRPSVVSAIDGWLEGKLAKGSTTAQDLADCMKVFASHGANLGQAIAYAEHLFAQHGTIKLMTGHKSKGLEFDNVFFLDSHLCRETEQDLNLKYVMETRSMNRLSYIDSERIKW